jgi:hypothetical protein
MSDLLEMTATRLRESGAPFLSAFRVAAVLGMSLSELSALTGIALNTLAAPYGTRRVDVALSPLVPIIAAASEMTGSDQRAAIWFKHQSIPGWAGKTAYDLVREGKSGKVLEYLEAVRSGVYA